jgi:hypothetical protein
VSKTICLLIREHSACLSSVYDKHGCAGLAGELTEQLRLLLEPSKASRLAGDYRSGKRISMRKVVAYIASHFRKDKIWLRRTRPDKRQYQVHPFAQDPLTFQVGIIHYVSSRTHELAPNSKI